MKVALKNVLPNPFRDMDRYPIHPQKILQLKASINSTGFWDNVVAREAGNGKIELAYGHHRLTALKAMVEEGASILINGERTKLTMSTEFDWIVRPLDDEEMLKIMAHENLDEWGHDASIERETIRAVVKAFADDRIELAKPPALAASKMRYAPSFCFGNQGVSRGTAGSAERAHPYTADTINGFLGGTMSARTIQYTLQALCLIERGHLSEADLEGLSTNECRVIVEETERSIKQAEHIKAEAERQARLAETEVQKKKLRKDGEQRAKQVVKATGKQVAKTLKGGGSQSDAREAAREQRASVIDKKQQLPEINKAAVSLSGSIKKMLDAESATGKKLDSLIKHSEHMGTESIHTLVVALGELIEWAEGYKRALERALNEGDVL